MSVRANGMRCVLRSRSDSDRDRYAIDGFDKLVQVDEHLREARRVGLPRSRQTTRAG